MKKDNQDYQPRHCSYVKSVDERCKAIPEGYIPRHRREEAPTTERLDPIPSDLLEKGAQYDENGHIVYTGEDGEPIKVIPERIDY